MPLSPLIEKYYKLLWLLCNFFIAHIFQVRCEMLERQLEEVQGYSTFVSTLLMDVQKGQRLYMDPMPPQARSDKLCVFF